MKKASVIILAGITCMALSGCAGSDVPGSVQPAAESTVTSEAEATTVTPEAQEAETTSEAEETTAAPEAEETEASTEAEEAETTPEEETTVSSEPATFCSPYKDKCIFDAWTELAIHQTKDGAYNDFEGNIGDVLEQYRDVDLTGDGQPDQIAIQKGTTEEGYDGYYYTITLSDGDTIETGVFSASPNEGEVIEYKDLDGDGTDEILITHYTDSTGGLIAWDIYLYYRDAAGKWDHITIKDDTLRLEDVAKECGFTPGTDDEPLLRSVQLTDDGVAVLIDYGMKDGPAVYLDFDAVLMKYSQGELTLSEHRADLADEYWPFDEENVQ